MATRKKFVRSKRHSFFAAAPVKKKTRFMALSPSVMLTLTLEVAEN
jgi:hypothetical protein